MVQCSDILDGFLYCVNASTNSIKILWLWLKSLSCEGVDLYKNVWPMVIYSRLRSSVHCWKSFWFLAFVYFNLFTVMKWLFDLFVQVILYIKYEKIFWVKVLLLLICLYMIWCWYAPCYLHIVYHFSCSF